MKYFFSLFLIYSFLILQGCTEHSREFQIHYTNGKIRYQKFCAQCHGKNSEGYKELYPPLTKERLKQYSLEQIICISKNGLKDTLTIGKTVYKLPMPPIAEITSKDLAFLMTYLYSKYFNEDSVFAEQTVAQALKKCKP